MDIGVYPAVSDHMSQLRLGFFRAGSGPVEAEEGSWRLATACIVSCVVRRWGILDGIVIMYCKWKCESRTGIMLAKSTGLDLACLVIAYMGVHAEDYRTPPHHPIGGE